MHNVGNVANVSGRKLLKPVIIGISRTEVYSVAGETWFGWWLVEHYLPYHVNRPYPPGFEVGDRSLDHIPDLVDTLVESLLPA